MRNENKKPKDTIVEQLPLACTNEQAAVEFMEQQRWGEHPACPHCGSIDVAKVTDGNGGRSKRFLWRCHDCKEQYTVRIDTVFEDSRLPLRHWCYAFWAACAHKKGVSALQISRQCLISYKSALFLMHRIRYAMTKPQRRRKLRGTVEADETYVGGKVRHKYGDMSIDHRKHNRNAGRSRIKTPVVAMVERGGDVRATVVKRVTANTLKKVLQKEIHHSARLMTDDLRLYRNVGRQFASYDFVRHSYGEYARGDVSSNTAESFFSLLKRGIYGTFHAVSKKHLHRYIDEFAFRWNTRKVTDGERIAQAIRAAEGKRLIYRQPA